MNVKVPSSTFAATALMPVKNAVVQALTVQKSRLTSAYSNGLLPALDSAAQTLVTQKTRAVTAYSDAVDNTVYGLIRHKQGLRAKFSEYGEGLAIHCEAISYRRGGFNEKYSGMVLTTGRFERVNHYGAYPAQTESIATFIPSKGYFNVQKYIFPDTVWNKTVPSVVFGRNAMRLKECVESGAPRYALSLEAAQTMLHEDALKNQNSRMEPMQSSAALVAFHYTLATGVFDRKGARLFAAAPASKFHTRQPS